MSMAFGDMNPFPLRQIQNRRTFHLEKVRLELTELEAIRQTFLRERDTSLNDRTLISDDEEDSWTTANKGPGLPSWLANHIVSYSFLKVYFTRQTVTSRDQRTVFLLINQIRFWFNFHCLVQYFIHLYIDQNQY